MIDRIRRVKKQKNAVILAHNYQVPEIQDIADFLGDSLELSKVSQELKVSLIVFCGVRFMAETAKILSPEKRVLSPVPDAACPLADKINTRQLLDLKNKYPDAWVVSYVNSTAEIKALSDICCTSANAVNVVRNIPVKQIIFVPDKNLGWWVKKNVLQKEIIIWEGFCYVHEEFSLEDLRKSKEACPGAEVMVHPECRAEILECADYVVSTSGMLKRAKESPVKKFIIGTEEGMIYRLKKENPRKEFYSLGCPKVCKDMKKISLKDVLTSLEEEKFELELEAGVIAKAKKAIGKMMKYV